VNYKKSYNKITPEGTRDFLFEECAARREIENKLISLFSENEYNEVITPLVEFYDVFDIAENKNSEESMYKERNMYKLTDNKNRLLVIRPDSTPPIIRLAETRLKDQPRPLKLCYNQAIYRVNPKEAGRDDEIAQCGIEKIYEDESAFLNSDESVLKLARKSLEVIAQFCGCQSYFEEIKFDEKKKHSYYIGDFFKGYISGYGKSIISGGKYKINDTYAEGFIVNISAITSCKVNPRDEVVRIALTKGRIEKEALKLFTKMGWDVSEYANKGRQLVFTVPDVNVELVVAKSLDVITFVELGVCDLGITGKDMLDEYDGKYKEVLDLNIGKCKFSLATKKGVDFYAGHKIKTVASKYPAVTRRFFLRKKGMNVNIIKIEGSVELAPLLEFADGIVDIVETGTTLRENGLEVIEDISDISTRMIVNQVKAKMKKKQIQEIISTMGEYIQ